MADGRHLEISKNVVLMDIINTYSKLVIKRKYNVKKTAVYTQC